MVERCLQEQGATIQNSPDAVSYVMSLSSRGAFGATLGDQDIDVSIVADPTEAQRLVDGLRRGGAPDESIFVRKNVVGSFSRSLEPGARAALERCVV